MDFIEFLLELHFFFTVSTIRKQGKQMNGIWDKVVVY